MVSPIEGLRGLSALAQDREASAASETGAMFKDVFQYAIDSVKETDAEKNQAEYLLSTGQLDNPAVLTIALSKNQISVDLLVQLRNKALDSYSELMRISI